MQRKLFGLFFNHFISSKNKNSNSKNFFFKIKQLSKFDDKSNFYFGYFALFILQGTILNFNPPIFLFPSISDSVSNVLLNSIR